MPITHRKIGKRGESAGRSAETEGAPVSTSVVLMLMLGVLLLLVVAGGWWCWQPALVASDTLAVMPYFLFIYFIGSFT